MVQRRIFFAPICRLLGTKIRDRRRYDGTQMLLMNAVYVGAGQALERVLDARQGAPADKRVPLAQTTQRGEAGTFQPGATLGEFTSCLRYATILRAAATHLNSATPLQLEVYAEDVKAYAADGEAYRQRAEGVAGSWNRNSNKQGQHRRTSKRVVWRGSTMKFGTTSVLPNACCRRTQVTCWATAASTSTSTSDPTSSPPQN